MAKEGTPDQTVNSDSVDVAAGFSTVVTGLDELSKNLANVVTAMSLAFGVGGSGSHTAMIGGGSSVAGMPNSQTIAQQRLAQSPSGLWGPAYATQTAGQTQAPPSGAPARPAAAPAVPVGQTTAPMMGNNQVPLGNRIGAGAQSAAAWGRQQAQAATGYQGGGPPAGSPTSAPPVGNGSSSAGGDTGRTTDMLRKIPLVGTIAGWGLDAVDEIQSQRQKNAFYQNVEGTDNLHGFGERYNEQVYSDTTRFVFSDSEARDLYKNTTKLGYSDRFDGAAQSRKGALDFAYSNKLQMGMDASESTGDIATASRSATMSFATLSQALQQVSKDAGQAGVNANLARASMMALIQTNLDHGVMGNAAVSNAQGAASYQVSMGRQFQGTDLSGAFSTGMNYMVAGTSGTTYNHFMATSMRDPGAAAGMRGKYQDLMTSTTITPAMKKWITDKVQSIGGFAAAKNDPASVDFLYPDFLDAFGTDWNAIKSTLQAATGAKYASDTDAWEALVQYVGGNTMNSAIQANQAAMTVKSGTADFGSNDFRNSLGTGTDGQMSYAGKAYQTLSETTKKSDPVIENVLKNMNQRGISQNDQKVVVFTAGGSRQMSLADAIANFPNEIQAGQVRYAGGDQDGNNVTNDLGVTNDTSTSTKAAALAERNDKTKATLGDAYTAGTSTTAPGGQKVQIDLTDRAAQLLKVGTSTDPQNALVPSTMLGDQAPAARDLFR